MEAEACWLGIDAEACYQYTLGRQTSEGGFCFYAYPQWGVEEPNAPDTYAGVEICATLGRPVPELQRCKRWLRAQQDGSGGYPTLIIGYAALRALHRLGAGPERDPRPFLRATAERLRLDKPLARRGPGWLRDALRCVSLWKVHGIAITVDMRSAIGSALASLVGDEGGYGVCGSNLPDSAHGLGLALAVGLPAPPQVLVYARLCERAPHGFNVTSHARSSSLECQRAGLRILRHFGACPGEPEQIRSYVASCQTATGGFGRAPGAIARLDDSMRAVQVLAMLFGL